MRTLLSFVLLNWLSTYYFVLFSTFHFNSANEINASDYAQYFNSQTDRYRRSDNTQYFGKSDKVWKPVVRELNALRKNIGLPALKWNPKIARDISPKKTKTNKFFGVAVNHPGETASATLVATIQQIFQELLYKNVRCNRKKCYAKHRNLRGLSSGLIAWRAKSIVCVAKIYGHKPRVSINCQSNPKPSRKSSLFHLNKISQKFRDSISNKGHKKVEHRRSKNKKETKHKNSLKKGNNKISKWKHGLNSSQNASHRRLKSSSRRKKNKHDSKSRSQTKSKYKSSSSNAKTNRHTYGHSKNTNAYTANSKPYPSSYTSTHQTNNVSCCEKPPGLSDLPDNFKNPGIWNQITAQASGEWIRGHAGTVTVELIKSLRDGQWLTSEAIDAYIFLLGNSKSNLRFISTAEFMGFDKSGANNITWKMNGAETVLVPAHINGNHWGMIIVDATNKTLTMMDSLNGGSGSATKTRILETTKKLIGQLSSKVSFKKFLPQLSSVGSWTVTEKMDVPQQRNGSDCGVFSLAYAMYAARGEKLNFSQKHIPYFRRKIANDLLNQIIS